MPSLCANILYMRFLPIALLLVTGLPLIQAADTESEVRSAEKAWTEAVVKRDFATLENVLGDKLIYAHSTGAIQSKQEYLARLRSGAQKYDTIAIERMRIVPYGTCAVSHSILRMTGVSDGKPFNDHVMMLNVWERQNGVWRLAAHQTTKLP